MVRMPNSIKILGFNSLFFGRNYIVIFPVDIHHTILCLGVCLLCTHKEVSLSRSMHRLLPQKEEDGET